MPMALVAAYGIYQGVEAGKKADAAQKARDAAAAQSTQIGLEDRDYYRQKFGGMNQMLVDYAMGNKPSPYLAQAKSKIQAGYQQGMTQLNEIQGRQGLGQSGIGEGQKIGLGMENAKAQAGLELQDQAQRYGVAEKLSSMENNSLAGSQEAQHGYGIQGGYANQDMNTGLQQQNAAFAGAAKGLGSAWQSAGGVQGIMGMFGGSGGDSGDRSMSGNPYMTDNGGVAAEIGTGEGGTDGWGY